MTPARRPSPPDHGFTGPTWKTYSAVPPRRGSPGLRLVVIALALLGSFLFARQWQRPTTVLTPISDPLPQAAYVRERRWTEGVRDAVRLAAGDPENRGQPAADAAGRAGDPPLADGFCVLCAEIAPGPGSSAPSPAAGEGGPTTTPAVAVATRPAALDWALMASLSRPIGLVVHVRAFPGNAEVGPEREPFLTLQRTLEETLALAAAAGLHPREFQIDFDCPVARLSGYAAGLGALRTAFPGQAFRPVARLGWLDATDFPPLARAAGGYVLQVHDLEHPTGRERRPVETLCDPQTANDAVGQAARLGVPFRVALPASGLRLTLDAEGRLVSATTEAAPVVLERGRPPSAGPAERVLLPDAGDMAALVAEWSRRRPKGLEGVVWDRLSVPGERRLDWPGPTFAAVRAGRAPRGRLQWEFPPPEEGSDRRELALRNVGEADASLPALLTVSCPETPVAAEATGPYEVATPAPNERRSPRDVRFRLRKSPAPSASAPRRTLAPGATLRFGSVRLSTTPREGEPGQDEVGAEMEAASPDAPSPPGR